MRLVIFALATVPRVDLAGAELIADLHKTLAGQGIQFRLADPNGEVRAALMRVGFDRAYGQLDTGHSITTVLSQWQAGTRALA